MEDRTLLHSRSGVALAAVFDGHNGDAAAEHCRSRFVHALHRHWGAAGAEAPSALTRRRLWPSERFVPPSCRCREGFVMGKAADDSGCTALAALCLASPSSQARATAAACCGATMSYSPSTPSTRRACRPSERVEAAGVRVERHQPTASCASVASSR